jgi:predicted nucleic acid-binding protein
MQEVLSKTDDPNLPLREQEFFELLLSDTRTDFGTRYSVRQFHAQWSDEDGRIMWDQEEIDVFWTRTEAEQRYAERRQALAERGFIYSDMDLIL